MRRSWLVALALLAIAAVVVVVVVVRLSDDDSGPVETTAWADSVCTSLVDWRASIASLADVGGAALTPETLRDRLDQAGTATQELVDELEALGQPDLEAGDEVKRALDDAVHGLQGSYDALAQAAQAATEAGSTMAFLQALGELGDDFQNVLQQASDIVATLQSASLFGDASAELERAFAEAGSCAELRAGG